MQLEYAEKEEAVLRGKRVTFVIPPPSVASPHHKAPVLRILNLADSSLMCCSQVTPLHSFSLFYEDSMNKLLEVAP